MPDQNEIEKLLRLKRYEQPPPEYFDSFLKEFQCRQRTEMLRQPLWRIVRDRIETFFSEHSLPRHSYASATIAVVSIGAVLSIGILSSKNPQQVAGAAVESPFGADGTIQPVRLSAEPGVRNFQDENGTRRRYVIDTRPVSYEPAFDF